MCAESGNIICKERVYEQYCAAVQKSLWRKLYIWSFYGFDNFTGFRRKSLCDIGECSGA